MPREVAAGTQVLQAVREDGARDEHRRNRLVWALVGLAVLAVVLVSVVLARVLGSSDDGTPVADPPANSTSSSPSASPPPSAAPTATAEGIESFIRSYLATAPVDQEAGFAELTGSYQRASPDYEEFWGSVRDVRIDSITPDPENLTVNYTYSYRRNGQARTDDVALRLTFTDGTYLIDGTV